MKNNKNNFTRRINKNIGRFSSNQYYAKNIEWFKEAAHDNAKFYYLAAEQRDDLYYILIGDFMHLRHFDLIGVRISEDEELNFIPLPLLIDILYGKNISHKTKIKKYLKFINSCDFYITRNKITAF